MPWKPTGFRVIFQSPGRSPEVVLDSGRCLSLISWAPASWQVIGPTLLVSGPTAQLCLLLKEEQWYTSGLFHCSPEKQRFPNIFMVMGNGGERVDKLYASFACYLIGYHCTIDLITLKEEMTFLKSSCGILHIISFWSGFLANPKMTENFLPPYLTKQLGNDLFFMLKYLSDSLSSGSYCCEAHRCFQSLPVNKTKWWHLSKICRSLNIQNKETTKHSL